MPLPNRLAIYLTGFIALIAGLAPLVGNLDWESTAGIIGGLTAIAIVVREWLVNWGKWEERKDLEPLIQEQLPGQAEDKEHLPPTTLGKP